jgi:hypothetical protein
MPPNSGSATDATWSAAWIWACWMVCITSRLSCTCVNRIAAGENSMSCNAPLGATWTVTASLGGVMVLLHLLGALLELLRPGLEVRDHLLGVHRSLVIASTCPRCRARLVLSAGLIVYQPDRAGTLA